MAEEKIDPDIAKMQGVAKKMQGFGEDFAKKSKRTPDGMLYQIQKATVTEDENGNPIVKKDVDLTKVADENTDTFREELYSRLGWKGGFDNDKARVDPRTGQRVQDSIDKDFGIPAEQVRGLVRGFSLQGYGFVTSGAAGQAMQDPESSPIMAYVGGQAQREAMPVLSKLGRSNAYDDKARGFVKAALGDKAPDTDVLVGKNLESAVIKALSQYKP